MAIIEMVMPKMGESVMEGTVLQWLKNVGDPIKQDEMVLEVATDKVDTEIPSTHAGILIEILALPGDVVEVGRPIARLQTEVLNEMTQNAPIFNTPVEENQNSFNAYPAIENTADFNEVPAVDNQPDFNAIPVEESQNNFDTFPVEEIVNHNIVQAIVTPVQEQSNANVGNNGFYSPLVLNIAKEEGISFEELSKINGSGQNGRVTKEDIIQFVEEKKKSLPFTQQPKEQVSSTIQTTVETTSKDKFFAENKLQEPVKKEEVIAVKTTFNGEADILEMDRTRKLIAQRMLDSKKISAHVTSFVEADVTNLVLWRNKMKHEFMQKEGDALTLTPLFIEAIAHALRDFPKMNASVDGDKIIIKKNINIGMAVALPDGNLIVPVIKNADQLNLVGITKKVNELAKKAREGKLTADDVSDGTYTMSNVGQFGNVMGTPILVQPQVGIMAFGTAQKKPAVVETPYGEAIGIRNLMFLSHSYDHRIIDGALGGMFVRKVADYLEKFDLNRNLW